MQGGNLSGSMRAETRGIPPKSTANQSPFVFRVDLRYCIYIPEPYEKGGPLGRTLFARLITVLIETLCVFALYYAYALLAETNLPLYILALILVGIDKAINAVRIRLAKE